MRKSTKLSRKSFERQQRQEWFVRCARELMNEKGFDKMSVDELAAKTEFTKRTLYLYFEDKREIFLAVLLDEIARINDNVHAAVDPALSGYENFGRMMGRFFEFARKEPKVFERLLDFESKEYYYNRPTDDLGPFGSQCVEAHNKMTALTVTLLESGKKDGSITAPYSAPEIMLAVWAATVGAVRVIGLRRDRLRRKEYSTTERRMYEICHRTVMRILKE